MDDCELGTHSCPDGLKCIDLVGGYTCDCDQGFLINLTGQCSDIDECLNDPCEYGCLNTPGSYECLCAQGYERLNGLCQNVDECSKSQVCNQNANCVDTIGSFECHCREGYNGDGFNCEDIDECLTEYCFQAGLSVKHFLKNSELR